MTKEELFRAVGEVREDQITEAERVKKESRPWRRYGTLAACLALVLAGAFALERLEGARKWAEIEESFQTTDEVYPESAPDAGGGMDGADYEPGGTACPAPCYSVNVEIGELSGGTENIAAMDGGKSRMETGSASCAAWLSPKEIFARDTAIFRGTVRELRYYEVEEVRPGGGRTQYTAAAVEVTDPIRGDLAAGEIETVLYIGGPDTVTSLSGPLEDLEVGSEAVFMPERASGETGVRNGASYFCYADLADFYLSEGLRFVFLDAGDGLVFERGVYEDIGSAETLDEVTDYIRRMIGEPERARSAAVPAESQADPGETDPALLDPSYGAEAPNGARELPGGAYVGES